MASVLSKTLQFRQQSRFKTDYKQWLEEQDKSHSLAENPQYHPPIPAVEGQKLVFHRVLDDSPREKVHDIHSAPRPVVRAHGEFLARASTRPHASLSSAITEALEEHCPHQLTLLLVLFIAFLCGVKTFTKRRRRAIALPISESEEGVSPAVDEKHLV
ncbi:hypothetical protein BBP40_003141 [Aspergillus hancockii]|nr:hypothetical protein BBP40_003141 [Aspergillus hancockii]